MPNPSRIGLGAWSVQNPARTRVLAEGESMAIVRAKYAGKEHAEMIDHRTYALISGKPSLEYLIEIGKPYPAPEWRKGCGTDLLWPVVRIIEPVGIELLSAAHVCRHEIEAGD
jgi:hypothetical protein